MNKNDIIDYVMHTPHNTNKAVLNSMLNQLTEGSGSSDLFSQVATVMASVSASENTGTFSDGVAGIAVTPFEPTGNFQTFIDSVIIEINGQTKTLNNFPLDSGADPATFDDGNTLVVPSFVYVGDTPNIGFYVYDNTFQRTDGITVKASAFNIYAPTDAIVAIYPTLLISGE